MKNHLFSNFQRYIVLLLPVIRVVYLKINSSIMIIFFATKNFFALSFLYHFFANQSISCMSHLSVGIWASVNPYIIFDFIFSGLECVLMLLNRINKAPTICLHITRGIEVKSLYFCVVGQFFLRYSSCRLMDFKPLYW